MRAPSQASAGVACVAVPTPACAPFRVCRKKTYSGKVGGRNDDVVITMQLAIAGARCFYSSEKYANFKTAVY